MSRNVLVPDAPTESDTTVDESLAEEQAVGTVSNDVAVETAPQAIPDKYQGKSLEEIVEMHVNAEKEIGRQANEVGTYRDLLKSMGDATKTDAAQTDTTEAVTPVEVTSNDLFDNPTEAIRSVVQEAISEQIAPMQQDRQQQLIETQISSLMADFPEAETTGADPAFQAFVEKSPYRVQDAQRWVETQDVDAARRLLSDWQDISGVQSGQAPVTETNEGAVRKARAVSTETGRGSGGPKGQDTLSKREVMKVFINDRDQYDSDGYQSKLLAHARRGTLVD